MIVEPQSSDSKHTPRLLELATALIQAKRILLRGLRYLARKISERAACQRFYDVGAVSYHLEVL
jgi:hypothetical protein